jgi:Virulence activator alpha C-term
VDNCERSVGFVPGAVRLQRQRVPVGDRPAQVASHRERLGRYEADWAEVQSRRPGGGPPPVTQPEFGNYATLRFGLAYERERIAWLEWMSQQLAAADPAGG